MDFSLLVHKTPIGFYGGDTRCLLQEEKCLLAAEANLCNFVPAHYYAGKSNRLETSAGAFVRSLSKAREKACISLWCSHMLNYITGRECREKICLVFVASVSAVEKSKAAGD